MLTSSRLSATRSKDWNRSGVIYSKAIGDNATTVVITGAGHSMMVERPDAVLDALIAITGHNFDFNQQAWQHWYSQQRGRPTLDARRD